MSRIYLLAALLLTASVFTGCYKKKDTIAIVKVVDESSSPVSNARVIIYGSGTQGTVTLRDTAFTNSAGEAQFNLNDVYQSGQAGVAIVDVEVSKDGDFAYGIMKIEQEETTREVVTLGQ